MILATIFEPLKHWNFLNLLNQACRSINYFCFMQQKKIALVEIGGSHDECMFSQINALQSINAKIFLVCDSKVHERLNKLYRFEDILIVDTTMSAIGDLKKMRGIAQFLKKNQVEKVVFNTAQGGHIRNLRFLISKKIACYGIVHTIKKFNESNTQKIIHKFIRKYAVLSDILKDGIRTEFKNNVTTYYPIEFPDFGKHYLQHSDQTWITIPGGIEARRKDLSTLVTMIEQTPADVKFVFAGKSDPDREEIKQLLSELEKKNLSDRLIHFDHYISNEEFYQLIRSSNFLMPLIHPDTPSSDQYPYNQISGSFNLAFGFRVPLLIHEAYSGLEDLRNSATFYHPATFGKDFDFARSNSTNKTAEMSSVEKWKTDVQRTNYLEFLDLI